MRKGYNIFMCEHADEQFGEYFATKANQVFFL